MRGSSVSDSSPGLVRLLACLLIMLFPGGLFAQATPESHDGQSFSLVYDVEHETTLVGTIQEIVTKHVAGSPAGMHLMVAAPQGTVDAHLGPFLSKKTKDAMVVGAPIQLVGAPVQLREKQYFMVRELSVGGSTVAIRNTNGLLVNYPASPAKARNVVKTGKGGQQ